MPDLFGYLLADVYNLWLQNGRIPRPVIRSVVMLVKKNPEKGATIRNLQSLTLLN